MSLYHKKNYTWPRIDYIFSQDRSKWKSYFEGNIEPASNHRIKIRHNDTSHFGEESNRGRFHVIYFNFELEDLLPDRKFKFDKFDIITNGGKNYLIVDYPELDCRIKRKYLVDQFEYGNRYRAIELNKFLDDIPKNKFYPSIEALYAEDNEWKLVKHLSMEETKNLYLLIESKRCSQSMSEWKYKSIHNIENIEALYYLDLGGDIGEVKITCYSYEQDIPHIHIDSIDNKFHTCLCLLIPKYFSHNNRYNQKLSIDQLNILNKYLHEKIDGYSRWKNIQSHWVWNRCIILNTIDFSQPDYMQTKDFII